MKLPVMDPCCFCEVVAGRTAEWSIVERTRLTLTMLNGRQLEAGQPVVLPLRHAPTLRPLDDAEGAAVMSAAQHVMDAMVEAYAPDGVLLYDRDVVTDAWRHAAQELRRGP